MATTKRHISIAGPAILFLVILLPLLTRAQYQINLNPDSVFHDSHSYYWTTNQTTFYGRNGIVYMIALQDQLTGRAPTVYTIDHKGKFSSYTMKPNNKNYFLYGYPDELDYTADPQGNSFAFEYNGNLWHYNNYKKWSTAFNKTDDSYDCFARFPTDATVPYHGYYNLVSGKPTVLKKGAFQHDSCLYFLSVYAQSSDPNYGKWCIEKYTYDKVQDIFVYKKKTLLSNVSGNMVGGIVPHTDSTGVTKLVINTYDEKGGCSLGWLVATTPTGGETTFTYQVLTPTPPTLINCRASALIGGTAKGGRTINNMDILETSDRMVLFGYGNSGTGVINYREYEFVYGSFYDIAAGSIVLPSSMSPASWSNSYNFESATELVPYKFNGVVGTDPNGFLQNNWIYYPDGNGKVCGLRFTSDTWKPIPDSTIFNDDLNHDEDTVYGPAVRSLWSLIGITDGGPPSSINWTVWDQHYVPETRPTELTLEAEGSYSSSVTTTSEDQYSQGVEGSGTKRGVTFRAGVDFGESFKKQCKSSTTWTNSLALPFELNESSQELGVYIYVIPTITRQTYKRYPWWDPSFNYPVPNSRQFRYSNTNTSVVYRNRSISLFPFNIHEPNSTNLASWQTANRTKLNSALLNSGLQAICNPSWSNPYPGQVGTFILEKDTSSEFSTTTSYEVDYTYTRKKPKVFEYQISMSHEFSYETSTENECRLSKKVEVSLKNMAEKINGINFNSYIVHTYWFKPQDYNWWFYDSTGADRPWYIAYSVSAPSAMVKLLSPASGSRLKSTGMVFNWDVEDLAPEEFEIFIGNSAHFSPSGTLFRMKTGLEKDYYLANLPFCKEGESYFWAVRVLTKKGDLVWSESRPFIYGEEPGTSHAESNLNVIPYPNPGTGKELHLLVDSRESGTVMLKITGLDGVTVYQATYLHTQPGSQVIDLPAMVLNPGVYLVETIVNQEKVTKKLVIGVQGR